MSGEWEAIPMSSPDLTEAETAAVLEVLSTPSLSMGPWTGRFEQAVAAYVGRRYAVAVSSGTSGLHLAMIAAGVGPGDVVITTPFSFVASANCILYQGAIPVFVDVDPLTGNLCPNQLGEAVRALEQGGGAARRWYPPAHAHSPGGPARLKAVLPVHVFGQPAEMDGIGAVSVTHGLTLVEDACEAIGAEYRQRNAGTLGDMAVFAFYPNKQMTTGEGGVVVTDNEEWDELLRSVRNQGRAPSGAWLHHVRLGYNYRLDELSAALGTAQLRRIDSLLSKRSQVATWYHERLSSLDDVQIPVVVETTTRMSWFVYVVRFAETLDRNRVMSGLQQRGVPARPYFTPIHLQPYYAERFGYRRGQYPSAELLGDTSLALPFSSVMTEDQVERVCDALTEAVQEQG